MLNQGCCFLVPKWFLMHCGDWNCFCTWLVSVNWIMGSQLADGNQHPFPSTTLHKADKGLFFLLQPHHCVVKYNCAVFSYVWWCVLSFCYIPLKVVTSHVLFRLVLEQINYYHIKFIFVIVIQEDADNLPWWYKTNYRMFITPIYITRRHTSDIHFGMLPMYIGNILETPNLSILAVVYMITK